MNAIRDAVNAFFALVHSWFRVDRIRVSPMEGRLLSLQPGQRILLRKQIYVVFGPPVVNPADKCRVTLQLDGDDGPARLVIQRTADGNTCSARFLDQHGLLQDIFDDDVDLLQSSHDRLCAGMTPSLAQD